MLHAQSEWLFYLGWFLLGFFFFFLQNWLRLCAPRLVAFSQLYVNEMNADIISKDLNKSHSCCFRITLHPLVSCQKYNYNNKLKLQWHNRSLTFWATLAGSNSDEQKILLAFLINYLQMDLLTEGQLLKQPTICSYMLEKIIYFFLVQSFTELLALNVPTTLFGPMGLNECRILNLFFLYLLN